MSIIDAEHARSQATMAVHGDIFSAVVRFPNAANAGEACHLAGLDADDIDRRLSAIPAPDEAGLQWLIRERERAEAAGTLLRLPG